MADQHEPTFELSADNSTITLTDGSVFQDHDHVNIIWTDAQGIEHSMNIHLEAKCIDRTDAECAGDRHVWAQAIGKPTIETGLDASDCVDWIQVGLHNYHFYGEGCETDPGIPVEPVEPPVEPVEPPTEPVEPPVDPVDPPAPVEPPEPPTEPVEPPVEPVDPPVDPGVDPDPDVPDQPDQPDVPDVPAPILPDPGQPTATVTATPTDDQPTQLAQTGPVETGLLLAAAAALVGVGYILRRKARKAVK